MAAPDSRAGEPHPVRKFDYTQRVLRSTEDLNFTERALARAYADYADADGSHVYPGIPKVAASAGCGERTAERWTPALVRKGYLILVRRGRGRGPGNGGTNSEYRLSQPAGMMVGQPVPGTGKIDRSRIKPPPGDGVKPPLSRSQAATVTGTVIGHKTRSSTRSNPEDSAQREESQRTVMAPGPGSHFSKARVAGARDQIPAEWSEGLQQIASIALGHCLRAGVRPEDVLEAVRHRRAVRWDLITNVRGFVQSEKFAPVLSEIAGARRERWLREHTETIASCLLQLEESRGIPEDKWLRYCRNARKWVKAKLNEIKEYYAEEEVPLPERLAWSERGWHEQLLRIERQARSVEARRALPCATCAAPGQHVTVTGPSGASRSVVLCPGCQAALAAHPRYSEYTQTVQEGAS